MDGSSVVSLERKKQAPRGRRVFLFLGFYDCCHLCCFLLNILLLLKPHNPLEIKSVYGNPYAKTNFIHPKQFHVLKFVSLEAKETYYEH